MAPAWGWWPHWWFEFTGDLVHVVCFHFLKGSLVYFLIAPACLCIGLHTVRIFILFFPGTGLLSSAVVLCVKVLILVRVYTGDHGGIVS